MRRRFGFATALLSAALFSPTALAGPYGDDMAKCLVASTTSEDKSALVQWMFAMSALHPDVKAMSAVKDSQRDALNRRFAEITQALLTKACLAQTRDAVKYEGRGTIEASFNVLGQVAGRELFANPAVAAGMKNLNKYFDSEKIQKTIGIK